MTAVAILQLGFSEMASIRERVALAIMAEQQPPHPLHLMRQADRWKWLRMADAALSAIGGEELFVKSRVSDAVLDLNLPLSLSQTLALANAVYDRLGHRAASAIAGEARSGETVEQGSTGTASTRAEGIAQKGSA